jgi:CRP/FNR family transcriptional regulator, cyclic AMP receptor protein
MPPENRLGGLLGLSSETRAILLTRAKIIRVRRGQNLLGRGERSSQVYVVVEGRLHVVLYSTSGREVSLRDLSEGDIFGELAAIDGEDRCANIVAASDARLMTFTRSDFRAAIHSSPEAADWLLERLAGQVRGLTEKMFELSVLNTAARLHSELLRLARSTSASGRREIVPAPTHAELANRIGTTREAVTREMRALSERKIIRNRCRRLEFLDLAQLQESVERSSLGGFSNDI